MPAAIILIAVIAGAALKPIIARNQTPDDGSIKVSATDLCAEYLENEPAASHKYELTGQNGGIGGVTVTGRVVRVIQNEVSDAYTQTVLLDGGEHREVRCDFVIDRDLDNLKAGQKVRIWGNCEGQDKTKMNKTVVIQDCKLQE